MPGKNLDVLLWVSIALLHFLHQLQFHLGLYHQPMWMTLRMFGSHNASAAWSGLDSNSCYRWNSQTLWCSPLALVFKCFLRKSHLVFFSSSIWLHNVWLLVPFMFSVFNLFSKFDSFRQFVLVVFTYLYACSVSLRQSRSSVRKRLMSRRKGTFSTTHRKTLIFPSTIRLLSLWELSKYFGFNSNLCCCLFSSSSS